MVHSNRKKIVAEALGTAFLLIGVVGSGIMGEALAGGNTAIALLANAIATGCILYVIITTLGPISGAHFNPVVTVAFALRGEHTWAGVAPYIIAQVIGGIAGVWAAHLMFDLQILQTSTTVRTGLNQWASEIIATFGLLFVIFGGVKHKPDTVPTLVALYITGAYWFTSSTSFANPAVTIARGFTDTFAGINPANVLMFIGAQIVGLIIGHLLLIRLFSDERRDP
ncbi:MAG: aquaporin family protein [Yoonia sp.]|nr:aquaporin family protein [Yoonia sp.]